LPREAAVGPRPKPIGGGAQLMLLLIKKWQQGMEGDDMLRKPFN